MHEASLRSSDFVQRKDNPGVLLGQFVEVFYGDESAVAYIEVIGDVQDCYRDDRNVRVIVVPTREAKPEIIRVPLQDIERWDSRELEKTNAN